MKNEEEYAFDKIGKAGREVKPKIAPACKPVSNPYRTDFMDLRIHDMDYGFTIWIYGSTDFMDFE